MSVPLDMTLILILKELDFMFLKLVAQVIAKTFMSAVANKNIVNIAIQEAESQIKTIGAGQDKKKLAIDIALQLIAKFAPIPVPEAVKSLVTGLLTTAINAEIDKFFNNKKEVLAQ